MRRATACPMWRGSIRWSRSSMRSTCCATSPATTSSPTAARAWATATTRTLVNLLTDQIEFADVVILNKVRDAGPRAHRRRAQDHQGAEPRCPADRDRPFALSIPTPSSTPGFSTSTAPHEHPLWAKELYGFANHTPETEEYGISSFVYRARAPFHPERIHAVLNGPLPGVIRAKGHFWIATPPELGRGILAGRRRVVRHARWVAGGPRSRGRWPTHPDALGRSGGEMAGTLGRPAAGDRLHRPRHGRGAIRARARRSPDARDALSPPTLGRLARPLPGLAAQAA